MTTNARFRLVVVTRRPPRTTFVRSFPFLRRSLFSLFGDASAVSTTTTALSIRVDAVGDFAAPTPRRRRRTPPGSTPRGTLLRTRRQIVRHATQARSTASNVSNVSNVSYVSSLEPSVTSVTSDETSIVRPESFPVSPTTAFCCRVVRAAGRRSLRRNLFGPSSPRLLGAVAPRPGPWSARRSRNDRALATSPSPTASRNKRDRGASGRFSSFSVNEDGRSTNANVGWASPRDIEHALEFRARAVAQHEHDAFAPRRSARVVSNTAMDASRRRATTAEKSRTTCDKPGRRVVRLPPSSSTLYAVAPNKKPCSLAPASPRRAGLSPRHLRTSARRRGADAASACPSLRRERTTGTLL